MGVELAGDVEAGVGRGGKKGGNYALPHPTVEIVQDNTVLNSTLRVRSPSRVISTVPYCITLPHTNLCAQGLSGANASRPSRETATVRP